MKCIIRIFLIALIVPIAWAEPSHLKGKTISICDDGAEWPPYTYYKRENGKKTNELVGYSVDVIREIFDKHGIHFTLEIIPWQRCKSKVDIGKKYQMFLSGGLNPERIKKYYITQPYYFTNEYYFWSERHHPSGLNIRTDSLKNALSDIVHKYRMGSVFGYGTGLMKTNGIDVSGVDMSAREYTALSKKLNKGYIDVFYDSIEILEGYKVVGKADLLSNKNIKYAKIPGSTPRGYQMMFTKNNDLGLALRNLIDPEITLMRATGRLDEILSKYIVDSRPIFN